MSLLEPEQTLSAIKQLEEKIKIEQGIFEEANKNLKGLQRDLRDKQTALDTLRKNLRKENLQEHDNDRSEWLEKLWKQQEKIKGQLNAQLSDKKIPILQEQNEFIDSELEQITQQHENILSKLELCREFEQVLHKDGKDIPHRSIKHKKEFAQFLEENESLTEDNKKKLLEENLQLIAKLNDSIQNLQEREAYLIEQKKELPKKDLVNNATIDDQLELQKSLEKYQAEITKEIDSILAESPIIEEQYKNVKLLEEEIKKIQDQIKQKTQIIEQSKQKEEQLFKELEQLEQKSYLTLSSEEQQQESPVNHYLTLQERANDAKVSLQRQIELNKLHTQLEIAQKKANDRTEQLEQLKLSTEAERSSTEKQIKNYQEQIRELQERIKELGREKQKQPQISHERSLSDELKERDKLDRPLSAQIDELTNENDNLRTKLAEVEKNAKEQLELLSEKKDLEYSKATEALKLNLQAGERKYAEILKAQSATETELSRLKSEQQEKQAELDRTKEQLTDTSKKLVATEKLYGQERSEQTRKLQAAVQELNTAKHQLESELKEQESQIKPLIEEKESLKLALQAEEEKYTARLKAQSEEAAAKLRPINKELLEKSQEGLLLKQENPKQIVTIIDLETPLNELTTVHGRNKDLPDQLQAEKSKKKERVELSGQEELEYNALKEEKRIKDRQSHILQEGAERIPKDQQDKIAGLKAEKALLLSQVEKLQAKAEVLEPRIQTHEIASKVTQSIDTWHNQVIDSGASVDKLVQNTTRTNIYEDDKILQAFKELSREQVQPIVNKFALESTRNFAQFAQENVDKLSEAFQDQKVLQEIENIEQRGYRDIHKKFVAEYKDIEWQEKESGKSFSLKQNDKNIVTINETILSYDDKDAKYKTSEGEEIKNARMVNIPLSIDMRGTCHMSFVVQDTNGRNISKEDAVYLTIHYKDGKLVHLTKPTEIFSCSDDNKSPLYLKRKGKTYTLPVDKSTLEQLEQEVLKNKGEYVGIAKNAQGNIRVNSAVHGLQPNCVTADPLFHDASRLLHGTTTTTTRDGSLNKKGLVREKSKRHGGSGRDFS